MLGRRVWDWRREVVVGAPRESPGGSPSRAGRAYVFTCPMTLSGSLYGGDLVLQWELWPGASAYWVYGASNLVYFLPGAAPGYQNRLAVLPPFFPTWSSSNGIGDSASNWTYQVLAVDDSEQVLVRSTRYGEHDFSISIP